MPEAEEYGVSNFLLIRDAKQVVNTKNAKNVTWTYLHSYGLYSNNMATRYTENQGTQYEVAKLMGNKGTKSGENRGGEQFTWFEENKVKKCEKNKILRK